MQRSTGRWLSNPDLILLADSRNVRFPEEVVYVARDGSRHVISKDFVSDGLTAPAWTWSIIGSPLTPRYRRPAGLHDVHAITRIVSKKRSVALLHETLIEGGTSRVRAWAFTRLVYYFGPQW